MLVHVLAIVGLAALCGGWVLLQRFIARRAPELPGVVRSCGGGCGGGGGSCTKACSGDDERPASSS